MPDFLGIFPIYVCIYTPSQVVCCFVLLIFFVIVLAFAVSLPYQL